MSDARQSPIPQDRVNENVDQRQRAETAKNEQRQRERYLRDQGVDEARARIRPPSPPPRASVEDLPTTAASAVAAVRALEQPERARPPEAPPR